MCAKGFDLNKESYGKSERMNRRAALKRLGITASMAAFSLLTVDDLARIASKKLNDVQICESLANEFKSAGAAVASPVPGDCSECDDSYEKCIKACNCPPACDCGGGSLWPWCLPYNFCIGPYGSCIIDRTICYQERCGG